MKTLVIILLLLVQYQFITAQEKNYYKGQHIIKSEKYEYKIEDIVNKRYALVSNKYNQLKNEWKYKNGDKIYFAHMNAGVEPQDINIAYNVYKEILSKEEILALKFLITKDVITYDDNKHSIVDNRTNLCISNTCAISVNGEILDIKFGFPNIPAFTNIHPDKFYALSQALKARFHFKIPEQTKELVDYVMHITFNIYIKDL